MSERQPGLLTGYQLRLPTYEGPLDLLLSLIERRQLAVTDVSLVEVTEQFIAYTAGLANASTEVLAEFMTIAARLLLLKSRSLLPKPEVEEVEEETDDLVDRLREYQQVKLAVAELREREQQGVQSWPRIAPLPEMPRVEQIAHSPATSLLSAIRRCLSREPERPAPYTPVPVISLRAMAERILSRLELGRARFSVLVGHSASRSEHAVAFVALLSLLRQRVIDVSQTALFGEIEIERLATPEPADD